MKEQIRDRIIDLIKSDPLNRATVKHISESLGVSIMTAEKYLIQMELDQILFRETKYKEDNKKYGYKFWYIK